MEGGQVAEGGGPGGPSLPLHAGLEELVPGARGAHTTTCHRGGFSVGWSLTPPPPAVLSHGALADWFPRAHMPTSSVFLSNELLWSNQTHQPLLELWSRLRWVQTRTHHLQPCSTRIKPVKHRHTAYLHIQPLRIYLHMLKYCVWSRSPMLPHRSPQVYFCYSLTKSNTALFSLK